MTSRTRTSTGLLLDETGVFLCRPAAGDALGLCRQAAFAGGLGAVAVGPHVVVYGRQVVQAVVIAGGEVVDAVCSRAAADVADATVPFEDLVSPLRPVGW